MLVFVVVAVLSSLICCYFLVQLIMISVKKVLLAIEPKIPNCDYQNKQENVKKEDKEEETSRGRRIT